MALQPELEYYIRERCEASKYYATARAFITSALMISDNTEYDPEVFNGFDEIHASWANAAHSWQIVTEDDGTRVLADQAYPKDIGPILGTVDGQYYAHFPSPATVKVPEELAESAIDAIERAEGHQDEAHERWEDICQENKQSLQELGYEFEDE